MSKGSEVDHSLFGGSKSKIGSKKPSNGKGKMDAIVIPESELQRMKNNAVIISKEEQPEQKKILEEQKERQQAVAKAKKERMLKAEEEKKKQVPLSDIQMEEKCVKENFKNRVKAKFNKGRCFTK